MADAAAGQIDRRQKNYTKRVEQFLRARSINKDNYPKALVAVGEKICEHLGNLVELQKLSVSRFP